MSLQVLQSMGLRPDRNLEHVFASWPLTALKRDNAMSEEFNPRPVIFFIARCHADLSWYLSINTLGGAANDLCVDRVRACVADRPRSLLHLLRTPRDTLSNASDP